MKKEAVLHHFISAFVLAVLILFALPAIAQEEAAPSAEETWVSFQCTVPSPQLLLPSHGGNSTNVIRSFIAGSSIFISSASSYLKCFGNALQHNTAVASKAVMDGVNFMLRGIQRKPPAPETYAPPNPSEQ